MSSKRAPWLAAGAAILLGLLLVVTWHAGQVSAQLDQERVRAELNHLRQTVASTQLELNQLRVSAENVPRPLKSAPPAAGDPQSTLRRQLSEAQAAASEYRAIIDRDRQASIENSRLLRALSAPGARLFSMKGVGAAADSIAYALVVENSRVVFVGCNLPKLPPSRQFQLWLIRQEEPKTVSAGLFNADDASRTVVEFDNPGVTSDISSLAVTDEPEGGSDAPTGNKLLETNPPEE